MKSYETESRKEIAQSDAASLPSEVVAGADTLSGALNSESAAGTPIVTSNADGANVSQDGREHPSSATQSSEQELATAGELLPQHQQGSTVSASDPSIAADTTLNEVSHIREPMQETEEQDDEGVEETDNDEVSSGPIAESGWRFRPPTREQVVAILPFLVIFLIGAVLRFWGLGDKALHHDESLHAYYSLQLMHQMENWSNCLNPAVICYHYDPLLHGPFQFHAIALSYKLSQILGAPDSGVNTFTVRIPAALLGSLMVFLPFFLRDYLGKLGALLACFLLAVSPSIVYFSRFAREDIYMAFFTLLMVVSVARYLRARKMYWLVLAAAGFALSYATKEATFLSIAVFGSFLGGLIAWELGIRLHVKVHIVPEHPLARYAPQNGAPLTLLAYVIIAAPLAKLAFDWMKTTSLYITSHQQTSDLYVQQLKENTVNVVPWIGMIVGIYVLSILVREMIGKLPMGGRHGLATRVDPERQRLLDTILTMPWTHWFFALLASWAIFLLLFTVLFTNVRGGIGDGIWQGLYYWLQQQQVARGNQPWYYYLLLIPLYEQIGLVFGIVGVVRCLRQPTRFRLFLVYWFVGNVFIYSWAAEKMPWLVIHMTIPMMILAAIGLEPAVVKAYAFAKQQLALRNQRVSPVVIAANGGDLAPARPRISLGAGASAIIVCLLAVLLLMPTLQNMYEVTYVHAADGPHEMMVYVQTTQDVNILMSRIDALDKLYDNGQHTLAIGLQGDATWPLIWYLRDYPNVCLNYPSNCPKNMPVIIAGGDDPYGVESRYAPAANGSVGYAFHQYHMRSWWDEGYKPPPCIATPKHPCGDQPAWGGVGPLTWLSYGDNPPAGATFNLGRAISNVWQWWWQRKAIGDINGSYDMVLFIRKDLTVQP